MARVQCMRHWLDGRGGPYGTAEAPPNPECLSAADFDGLVPDDFKDQYCDCALPHNEDSCNSGATDTGDLLSLYEVGGTSGCTCIYVEDIRRGYCDWLDGWFNAVRKYNSSHERKL